VFDEWWTYARSAYLDLAGGTPPQAVTLYYDPLLDVHHRLPVVTAIINALYLAPLAPDDARRLLDAGLGMVGARGEGPPVVIGERMTAVALLLAREWGLDATAERLAAGAEAGYHPGWDRVRGEHTWGFGLGEEHPRGQYNAIMAAAEATTPGAWSALANEPPPPVGPEVVGVDFPTVALRQAAWIDGRLHLATETISETATGSPTAWRVAGLDDPHRWTVASLLGAPAATAVEGGDLVIRTVAGPGAYVVHRRSP
jgi:hypothetical protein